MATQPARLQVPSGPSRHVYDAIVVGSQLGGALTAALLAKRKHRVLLIDHDGTGTGYEHGGYVLPYGPSITPPLKAMPLVEEAFTELGLTTTVQRSLRPHQPELQLVLPRHRVDLNPDPARRRAELVREFGDTAEGLLAALTATASQHEESNAFLKEQPNLPPDGFLESWGLKKKIGQHEGLEKHPRLSNNTPPGALLRGLLPFLIHLDEASSPLALTRPLSQALQSPQRFPGGNEGLREMIVKRLSELGGDVLTRENSDSYVVEEITFDGARFSGVKLVRSDVVYRASCLVSAMDSSALRRLITDRKRHRSLLEHLDASNTRSLLFAVNWVVPANTLPRGMGELLLLESEDVELRPLLIQVHPARTPAGQEDESLRVVCAAAFVPASVRDLGEEHMQVLAQRIDKELETLMPFTLPHRVLRSAPYLDAGGVRGSRLMPHPLYTFEAEAFLGVTGLKQRTPAKNILLAGREVLPGLGLEGEFLAGMRAARLVQDMLKKKTPTAG